MKIALFDIDDTIASAQWRNVLKPPNSSWDDYHSACSNDAPNAEVIELIASLSEVKYTCLGFTRRPEKWRQITNSWLMKNKVNLTYFFMADDKDFRNAVDCKIGLIETNFTEPQRREIQFVMDDDPEICAAITEKYGITTLLCRHRTKN